MQNNHILEDMLAIIRHGINERIESLEDSHVKKKRFELFLLNLNSNIANLHGMLRDTKNGDGNRENILDALNCQLSTREYIWDKFSEVLSERAKIYKMLTSRYGAYLQ